jgi:hypothetical protein
VTHLFTCAVPYLPTSENYIPLEAIVSFLPSLGYQLQFGSEEGVIESHTQDKAGIRNFLNALYGGRTSDGKAAMLPEKGVDLELMLTLNRSPLVSEDELNYYVEEYSRHGLKAPCKCQPICHSLQTVKVLTDNRQLLPQPQGQLRGRQAVACHRERHEDQMSHSVREGSRRYYCHRRARQPDECERSTIYHQKRQCLALAPLAEARGGQWHHF